jgi:membrane-associated protein
MIAGASKYSFKRFLIFNLTGALTWIGTLVPLGYFVGKVYPDIIHYSIYILVIFIIIASTPMLKIFFSRNNSKN